MNLTALLLTELFGTMLLIILGNGIVANVVLKGTKGNNAGWLAITFGWGFAVFTAALISGALNGAGWLNPAVMIGAVISSKGDVLTQLTSGSGAGAAGLFIGVLALQLIGAMLGQIIIDLLYYKHIQMTLFGNDEFATSNVLAMHSTGPTTKSTWFNFGMEFVGTMVLVFAILSLGQSKMEGAIFGPVAVAIVIIAIGLSLGGTTGYAINPVRDLGPRIVHMLAPISGKGKSDWGYSWIPVAAPMAAGIIAGALFLAF
ncbi:MIP/aquaporin family protein [[Acholeplasma] multilocale]|uniref:MIP/aquaporin family protein n=1 Tax=[Acholeplasma] multilocale TaxID=264638 RepID=UPI00047A231B|nr:MIP/aquaporin family protein [[Acholeplasma] multilocale]